MVLILSDLNLRHRFRPVLLIKKRSANLFRVLEKYGSEVQILPIAGDVITPNLVEEMKTAVAALLCPNVCFILLKKRRLVASCLWQFPHHHYHNFGTNWLTFVDSVTFNSLMLKMGH